MSKNNYPEDSSLDQIIRKLLDRIERLERAVRSSTQVTTGEFILKDSELDVQTASDTSVLRVGTQNNGDYGLLIARANGTPAISVKQETVVGGAPQLVRVYDRSGNVILGESSGFDGFDSPKLNLEWRPSDRSDAKSTNSATFVSLFYCYVYKQNPSLHLLFHCLCSDTSTGGEIRVVESATGEILGDAGLDWTGTIAAGFGSAILIESPHLILPDSFGTLLRLEIQVRRTAGTGSVSVGIARSTGREV